MFNFKREDATQANFEKFLKKIQTGNFYGYCANDAQVLTDDIRLFKVLLAVEEERRNKKAEETNETPYDISVLETFGYKLSKDAEVDALFKNALYVEQQDCQDGWTGRNVGGHIVIVLTNSPERLKEFVQPIVNNHVEEFQIKLERGNSFYVDVNEPYLRMNLSINNQACQLESNLFATRVELKDCAKNVLSGIDKMITVEKVNVEEQES